jgi:hypothetical protein
MCRRQLWKLLTVSRTVLAAAVVACLCGILVIIRLLIFLPPRHRHGTPALDIGALLTGAADPAATHGFVLTVLQWTVVASGLCVCKANVLAWLFIAGVQVDHSRRTVVPRYRCMITGMTAGVAMAHLGGFASWLELNFRLRCRTIGKEERTTTERTAITTLSLEDQTCARRRIPDYRLYTDAARLSQLY